MDSNLEKVLRKRQEAGQCIICGKEVADKIPFITFDHAILNLVAVCERHIKQSGNDA